MELFGHESFVTSVAFSVDGHLASTSFDKTVRIWRPGVNRGKLTISWTANFFVGIVSRGRHEIYAATFTIPERNNYHGQACYSVPTEPIFVANQ